MSLTEYDMYIDGSFVGAEHNQRFESLNPENNQPVSYTHLTLPTTPYV